MSSAEAYANENEEDAPKPVVKGNPVEQLAKLIASQNLVPDIEDEELNEISERVITDYTIDKASRSDWEDRAEKAMDLAMMVTGEPKNYPFDKASNVKWPLIAEASIQYNALAYPAIVQGDRVAKCKTNGKDPTGEKAKRAERVSEHLSWQLTSEMPEWEDDTDKLLIILPIVGCAFRKTYFDPALGRKCSRLVTADRFVINYYARSLEDAPRFTEQLYLYPQEIRERINDGRFVEFDYGIAAPDDDDTYEGSGKEPVETLGEDEDAPHLFLEQHRYWDLDGDGYPEPYIVTVHKQTGKVCRVVANFTVDSCRLTPDGSKVVAIRPQTFFTVYRFLPSPDGGFYGMGLGTLLHTTNEAINATLNEMLDAGHLTNIQGGFVSSSLSTREKTHRLKMGEWKVINTNGVPLNQAIMPITYPGPSDTLFKLVGLLIDQGKSLASIKDVMTGETGGKVMQPTTVLALIEQGMRVVQGNFKRTHRGIRAELAIHGRLNYEHLTPETYNAFFDDQQQFDPKADYNPDDMDIVPVSDPTVATRMQALAKAQITQEIAAGKPWFNGMEIDKRSLHAAEIEDVDALFAPPPQPDPGEVAFMEAMRKLSLQEIVAKINESETKQIKNIADAEAAEVGQQLTAYDAFLRYLTGAQNAQTDAGGMAGVVGQPNDAPPAGSPPIEGGAPPVGPQGLPVDSNAGQPGAMGVPAA